MNLIKICIGKPRVVSYYYTSSIQDQKQEDGEFKTWLCYTVRLYLKKKKWQWDLYNISSWIYRSYPEYMLLQFQDLFEKCMLSLTFTTSVFVAESRGRMQMCVNKDHGKLYFHVSKTLCCLHSSYCTEPFTFFLKIYLFLFLLYLHECFI